MLNLQPKKKNMSLPHRPRHIVTFPQVNQTIFFFLKKNISGSEKPVFFNCLQISVIIITVCTLIASVMQCSI